LLTILFASRWFSLRHHLARHVDRTNMARAALSPIAYS